MFMDSTEAVVIKVVSPTRRKANWLVAMAELFSQAVQLGLDAAQELRTSSRAKIHKASYYPMREQFGLPSDYARMAVNAAVSLARSYYGLRKSKRQKRTSFPRVNGSQGVGLGVNAYALILDGDRWVLRVSTGTRGEYIWLPLCVPTKFRDRMGYVRGDAKLFQRDGQWYAMLPVRTESPTPAACGGDCTYIGVDLGIVRLATVSTPDHVQFFDGKAIRHRREHFADLRRRYQRHNRLDRVKASRGKERRWMRNINHTISRQIVDLAAEHEHPVLVFERLDGIRYRARGSKRFNRMMASWAFRELINFVTYKAEREGIPVVFVDPRGTSKTCSKCGHDSRANRPDQSHFRCVSCGYQANADLNAARNIAALGPTALEQGLPDTARSQNQTGDSGLRPDGVQGDVVVSHRQTSTSRSS